MHFYYIEKTISQKNIFFTLKFLDGGHRIQKKLKFHGVCRCVFHEI